MESGDVNDHERPTDADEVWDLRLYVAGQTAKYADRVRQSEEGLRRTSVREVQDRSSGSARQSATAARRSNRRHSDPGPKAS